MFSTMSHFKLQTLQKVMIIISLLFFFASEVLILKGFLDLLEYTL